MARQIRLSGPARRDIQKVLAYTLENFGPLQHDEYRDLIRDALATISQAPTHTPAKQRDDLRPGVWVRHIGQIGRPARHIFIYRIADDGCVEIARMLHDAMDVERHLPADFE